MFYNFQTTVLDPNKFCNGSKIIRYSFNKLKISVIIGVTVAYTYAKLEIAGSKPILWFKLPNKLFNIS